MAAEIGDLVQETSSTTGTGDFTLVASNGRQTFAGAFSTGGSNVFYYFIMSQAAVEWEYGTGHMSDSTTLVRDTVIASTNSNAAVDFSAGTKDVVNDTPAEFQLIGPGASTPTQIPKFGVAGQVIVASGLLIDSSNNITPASNDNSALGTATVSWADLFLASGAVINFNNGNATITHSSGLLTFSTPVTLGTSNSFTCGTIELGAASDTTIARASAGHVSVEGTQLLLDPGGNGLVTRTAAGTTTNRSIAVTASSGVSVSNGDGQSGNPTLAGIDASTTVKGVSEFATAAEYRTGTDTARSLVVDQIWTAAAPATLTDAATITVDMAAGIDFGGSSSSALALGGNRTLGAPSNVKSGQKGVLWFSASSSTRTLTLNAAWVLVDGIEVGPYSITTSQILGVAYVNLGTTTYVTAILRDG